MPFVKNIIALLHGLVDNNIAMYPVITTPTDGTAGTLAGLAAPSSLAFDYVNGVVYVNAGTKASPVWESLGSVTAGSVNAAALASDAVTTVKILNSNVTLAKLASGITPSHVVKYAGSFTTLGGDDTETITVTGALATDVIAVTLCVKGATPRTILTAIPSTNTITVVFSGDPSNDHILNYTLLRAAA